MKRLLICMMALSLMAFVAFNTSRADYRVLDHHEEAKLYGGDYEYDLYNVCGPGTTACSLVSCLGHVCNLVGAICTNPGGGFEGCSTTGTRTVCGASTLWSDCLLNPDTAAACGGTQVPSPLCPGPTPHPTLGFGCNTRTTCVGAPAGEQLEECTNCSTIP